jgi:polyhydroxyalkanoate synthesis regulator phasin
MKKDKESEMPEKESFRPGKQPVTSSQDGRASAKLATEGEITATIQEEIRNAAKELVEEQRMAIRLAVEEQKRIIREVLEQEKLSIRANLETTRESIIRLGAG